MNLKNQLARWPQQRRRQESARKRRDRLARNRVMLSQLAVLRFGPEVGERVHSLLEKTEDEERLEAAGALIVSVETSDEIVDLLARSAY